MTYAIRVVLAEDHTVVRAGLKALFARHKDIRVVAEATNGREAVALTIQHNPDVLITGIMMGMMDGISVTRQVVQKNVKTRVLILTMLTGGAPLVKALEAGATGYLMKSASPVEILEGVRSVARGDIYVQATAAKELAEAINQKIPRTDAQEKYRGLTERERAVFRYIAAGLSGPEIGERLFISPKTVDTYKHRVNEKLGFSHRHDYVDFALKHNLLRPADETADAKAF